MEEKTLAFGSFALVRSGSWVVQTVVVGAVSYVVVVVVARAVPGGVEDRDKGSLPFPCCVSSDQRLPSSIHRGNPRGHPRTDPTLSASAATMAPLLILDQYYLAITFLISLALQGTLFISSFLLQTDKMTDFGGSMNFLLLAAFTLGAGKNFSARNVIAR
jgi:hypothetical protein